MQGNLPLHKKVVITGAAGRIGSQLLFLVAQGLLYGDHQTVELMMLEKQDNLNRCCSLKMELEDSLFPLLKSTHFTQDNDEAFIDADCVFFCGAKTCLDNDQKQMIQKENWRAFRAQGDSINRLCDLETLFLMVANPCNTNTLVLIESAPRINPFQFHALVRLDQNRAQQMIAQRAGSLPHEVKNVIVWGNHSPTIVVDSSKATINHAPVTSLISHEWLTGQLIEMVQYRGAQITKTSNGFSSCSSAAYAAIESMKALMHPTPKDSFFCSGMLSRDNPFGFDNHLVFSFPIRTISRGNYDILSNYKFDQNLDALIHKSELELIEERSRII